MIANRSVDAIALIDRDQESPVYVIDPQKRIRENLKVFEQGSEDAKPIVAQFVAAEKLIGEIGSEIDSANATMKKLEDAKERLLKTKMER